MTGLLARLMLLAWLGCCLPCAAQLDEARKLLEQGRASAALELTDRLTGLAAEVIRGEAFMELERYSDLETLLARLKPVGDPADFRLLLLQSRYDSFRRRPEAALRNAREALRLAGNVDDEVEALDRLVLLRTSAQDLESALEYLERSELLAPRMNDPYSTVRHLLAVATLQEESGRRSEAIAAIVAARAMLRSLGMPIRAAQTTSRIATSLLRGGHLESAFATAQQAVEEMLLADHPEGAATTLRLIGGYGYSQEQNKRAEALAVKVISALPGGRPRAAAMLHRARIKEALGQKDEALGLINELLEDVTLDGETRAAVLAARARDARVRGRGEEARRLVEEALDTASLGPAFSTWASGHPLNLLMLKGELERDQRLYAESAASFRRALELEAGADWESGRRQARRGLVATLLDGHDIEGARSEFAEELREIADLPSGDDQAAALVACFSSLEAAEDRRATASFPRTTTWSPMMPCPAF